MIQRSLLRQSRIASSSIRAQYRAPISRSHFPPVRIYQPLVGSAQRWQSTTTDNNGNANSEASTNGASSDAAKEEDPIKKELEAKNKEIIELKDKYLRSIADFRNLQDRTKRDIESARSFAITRFASDLIESIDNLDRALATAAQTTNNLAESSTESQAAEANNNNNNNNNDFKNLLQGLKMTERILMQTLKKHGLERFDPSERGERFDPNLHEATFQTKVEGKEDGTVFMTQQKGFLLNGRVVRAAKVGVVKNS